MKLRAPVPGAHRALHTLHASLVQLDNPQIEALDVCAVHHDTIRRWFNGRSDPHLSTLETALNRCGYRLVAVPLDEGA